MGFIMQSKQLIYNDIINYPKLKSTEYEIINSFEDEDLLRTDLVITTPFGYKRMAEIIKPIEGSDLAAAIFIHWYEPGEPKTSNRFQFVEEAKKLAKKGVVCLCVETLWSDLDFFYKRTQKDDIQNSFKEVINFRRFLDLLFLQKGINVSKSLLVGHDFGGMYGILLGSIDSRIKNFVVMSATPRFSDWYLYYPTIEEQDKVIFKNDFEFLDPVTVLSKIKNSPILFQFGQSDNHVPIEKANELFSAALEPKEIIWYEAGHGLNKKSKTDRLSWIKNKLDI